jgi:peptidyl-prolyl cis-trans isomerase SurA
VNRILLSLPFLLLALAPAAAQERRPVDRVAAIVNGDVVTLSELAERSGAEYRRAMALPPGEARERARAKALQGAFDTVVAERLLEAEVKSSGVEVTEAQIDAAIEDVKKRNNFTDDMLRQALVGEGLDIPGYRARLRKDFESHLLLMAKVGNRVKVGDDEVKAYYQSHAKEFAGEDEVKLRLILFAVPAGSSPAEEARARAGGEATLVRIAAGEDFADLARQLSQGPGAAAGGDLGWVRRGTMPIDLERAAFALEPGTNTPLVRAKTGYVIFKCEDRKSAKVPPLEDVKDRIREKIAGQQAEAYRKQYLEELRREASIEVKIPELGPAPGP